METLIERLQRHEGFIAFAKIDVPPNYVIGYGHDICASDVDDWKNGISESMAMDILINDIDIAKARIAKEFPWVLGMDENRLSILTEMAFQMGIGGVKKFPKMLNALREKNYVVASQEMLNSQWHKQTPKRCTELSELMLTGG